MMKIKIERDVNGKVVAGIVSKTFLKNADIFGSEEYVEVQKFYATHSGATIKVKKSKSNPDKKTNKHLTYENMHLFIRTVAGDEAQSLLDEMEKIEQSVQEITYFRL